MIPERVILVDEQDKPIGTEEKIRAHELGLLHRAFSVFVFRHNKEENSELQFLLQQRHPDKYHCGGLWTNSCCSHPRENETVALAAQRRLKEEMSLDIVLRPVGSFVYRAEFSNGLTEYEFDHVLLGEYLEGMPILMDANEVQSFAWVTVTQLKQALELQPHLYTPWFKPALTIALEALCLKY